MPKLSARIAATIVLVCVGILSPWAEMLFSVHMAQHLLLIAAAAPLLVLGGITLRMPPVTGWLTFVVVFLFWHWPAAFHWASGGVVTELLELASILIAAICFWSSALCSRALSDGARALLIMTAAFVTDLPGVIMLFSPRVLYVMPGGGVRHFELAPLQDQQIAGLLMWVPANLIFFAIATFLFGRWMGAIHRST